MALFRCGGDSEVISIAETLKGSNDTTPLGAVTIADGLDAYKYIYMCRVQGEASAVIVRDNEFMTISDFITAGSITLGSTTTCTVTYTDNNTLTVSQSSAAADCFIILFK